MDYFVAANWSHSLQRCAAYAVNGVVGWDSNRQWRCGPLDKPFWFHRICFGAGSYHP